MPAQLTLPVIPRDVFDHSILSTFSACPRKALYSYELNRSGNGDNPNTRFGSAYHRARYTYEKLYIQLTASGRSLDDEKVREGILTLGLAAALKDWTDPDTDDKFGYLDRKRLVESCELGFQQFLLEKSQGAYEVIAVEVPFTLKLPSGASFGGKIDRIDRWNGKLWVRDYKTTSRAKSRKNKSDPIRPQYPYEPLHSFSGYTWAAEKLSGQPIEGVLVDGLYNTKENGPELFNVISSRSELDIEDFIEWAEGEIASYKEAQQAQTWIKRTNSCNMYSGCFYREACLQSSWGRIEGWLEDHTVEYIWNFEEED